MAGGDEDLGLGLRLPWGKISPPADEAFAPPPPTGPPAAPPSEGSEAGPPPDPIALQRSFEALLEAIDGRFDRLDERLARLEHGLPERLDLVGARLAEATSSAGASPPDSAVIERLERGFDLGVRLLEGRLERLEDRVASSTAATVDALSQVGSGGLEETDADAVGAVLDRRLDRLETLIASFHETTMGALGRHPERTLRALDASHAALVDRLAQLAPALAVAQLGTRLDLLRDQIDSYQQATAQALEGVAPAELVASLIQGVVTTGEMLDAELIDLKRLLSVRRPPGP